MVGGDSMGPGLQLVGARFWNFLLEKLSLVRTSPIVRISRYSNGRISVVREDTVRCLGIRIVYVDLTLTRSMVKVKVK